MSNRKQLRKQQREDERLAIKSSKKETRRKKNVVKDSNKLLFSLIWDTCIEKETAETANEKWLAHCEKHGLKEHAKDLIKSTFTLFIYGNN